jgi:hypothetical protein
MVQTDTDDTFKGRKVIIFNGPPGSGKDTGALIVYNYLMIHAEYLRPRHITFMEPVKRAAHSLYNIHEWPPNYFDQPYFPERHKQKDVPHGEFFGLTPREAYTHVADCAKGKHGDEFLGFVMRRRMRQSSGCMVFIISDCGFIEELAPVVRLVGESNVLFIELVAAGKNYDNDVREDLRVDVAARFPKVKIQRIMNDFDDKELFRIYCHGAVKAFLDIQEKD